MKEDNGRSEGNRAQGRTDSPPAQDGREVAQSENDLFYSRLIEASPDPIFIYVDEVIIFANRAAGKLLAAESMDQIIGRSIWDFSPIESRPALRKGIDLLLSGVRRYLIAEDKVTRIDGEVINVEISTSFFPFNNQNGILAFFRDITKRRRAEDELKRSENIYRTIFETTGTAMIFFEEDTTISLANSECLIISGYTKDEVEGKMSWRTFIAEEDLPKLMESHRLRNINPDLAPRTHEFKLKNKDGSCRDVFMTIAMIPGTRQRIASIVDISDRKRAEKALIASEEKYRLVVENAKEAIVIVHDGVVRYANPKMAEIYGCHENDLTGRIFFDMIDGESRVRMMKEYIERMNGREPGFGEPVRIADSSGRFRWLEIYSVPIVWEEKQAMLIFLNDITERKLAEEALHASEERYRLLAENAGDIILVCEMDGTINYVNRAGCEMTGMSVDEIVGMRIPDLIYTKRRNAMVRLLDEGIIEAGRVYRHKAEIKNREGERVKIETMSNLIRLDRGKSGILVLARDVTERSRLEREIINIAERIRLQVGRDLHDDVSPHILAIGAFAKVLQGRLEKKGVEEAAEVAKIKDFLNEATMKIRRLVKGLCPVDLDAKGVISAIQNLADRIRTMYGLECDFSYDHAIMIYDNTVATSIYYIAQEAVYNAAKHARATSIKVTLFSDQDGNYLLQIRDNGTGIPPSQSRRKGEGLKIMRHRAEILNGLFEIRKNEPGGTVVSCAIPASPGDDNR